MWVVVTVPSNRSSTEVALNEGRTSRSSGNPGNSTPPSNHRWIQHLQTQQCNFLHCASAKYWETLLLNWTRMFFYTLRLFPESLLTIFTITANCTSMPEHTLRGGLPQPTKVSPQAPLLDLPCPTPHPQVEQWGQNFGRKNCGVVLTESVLSESNKIRGEWLLPFWSGVICTWILKKDRWPKSAKLRASHQHMAFEFDRLAPRFFC